MIKNIIFDMGMVLLDFCWREHFENCGLSSDVIEEIADVSVRHPIWNEFDKGIEKKDAIVDRIVAMKPQYETEIRKVLDYFPAMIKKYPYTDELIDCLKNNGYKVYILSNFPEDTYVNGQDVLDFINKVDGQIISYMHKVIKPSEEIYKLLLETYNLNAEECVFIDDKKENVEGAKALGIKGFVFTSYSDLMHFFKNNDIKIK